MEAKWEPINEQKERLAVLKMRVDIELDTLDEVRKLVKSRIGKLIEAEIEHIVRVLQENLSREVSERIIELDEKHLDQTKLVRPDHRA